MLAVPLPCQVFDGDSLNCKARERWLPLCSARSGPAAQDLQPFAPDG